MQFTEQVVLDAAGMQTTKDGYLVANPRVARTGIQLYAGTEMGIAKKVVRVYRPDEEVFSADAMRSLAHRPVTLDHPAEMVNAQNWRQYAIGQSGGDVARDGDCIRVPLVLMDAAAIAEVRAGKAQLSVGYTADLKWGEGKTASGEVYDAVFTNIRANHVAVVGQARAGPNLRIGDNAMPDYTVTDEARKRVEDARNEMIDRITNAWKGGPDQRVTPLQDGQQFADEREAAHAAMVHHLTNGWREGAR